MDALAPVRTIQTPNGGTHYLVFDVALERGTPERIAADANIQRAIDRINRERAEAEAGGTENGGTLRALPSGTR